MSDTANKVTIQGFPTLQLLTLLFVLLKVFGKITWSWWLVFSPLWAPLLLVLSIVIVVGLVALSIKSFQGRRT